MAKPAAIHMTRKPCIRKERLLKIYCVSSGTSAIAGIAIKLIAAATAPAIP